MNVQTIGLVVVTSLTTLALTAVLAPVARSQIQTMPSYIPIGVSANGNASTVWFHEPSTRQALVCQTIMKETGPSSIQCAATKLP